MDMFRRLHIGLRPGRPTAEDGNNNAATAGAGPAADSSLFEPSLADVLVAKALLQRGRHLPLELVDAIADMAEYWPHSTTTVDYLGAQGKPLIVAARGGRTGRGFCLRTPPIGLFRPPPAAAASDAADAPPAPSEEAYTTAFPAPRLLGADERDCPPDKGRHWMAAAASPADENPKAAAAAAAAWPTLTNPCRKIVFSLTSHDQGWASSSVARGSYQGSYSWFDVGQERFVEKTPPPPVAHDDDGDDDDTNNTNNTPPPPTPDLADLRSIVPPVTLVDPPTTVHVTPAPGVSITITAPRAPRVPRPPPVDADAADAVAAPDQVPEFALPPVEMPGPHRLQANRVAVRQWTEHTIVWSWTDTDPGREAAAAHADTDTDTDTDGDGDAEDGQAISALEKVGRGPATGDGAFVRQLLAGDVVTVWAKAVFPGWLNNVAKATVKVYWAV